MGPAAIRNGLLLPDSNQPLLHSHGQRQQRFHDEMCIRDREKNASTRDYKIIPVNEENLTHVFRITEALERKEYVCVQGDRYLNKEKLRISPFMGKEAEFPMGPFLLASKMRVPVVFYFACLLYTSPVSSHMHQVISLNR